MPKRILVKKFNTKEVQGAGSFVKLTSLTVGEIRKARKLDADERFEAQLKMITEHLVDWNWVDNDGESLPLPSENPKVVDILTNEESDLIGLLLVRGNTKN